MAGALVPDGKRTLGVHCADHSDKPALASCSLCNRTLCDACFEFESDHRAVCLRCAYEVGTRGQRSITLPIAFVGLGVSVLLLFARKGALGIGELVLAALVLVVGGGAIFWYFHKDSAPVERRDREANPPPESHAAHPYRQRVKHVAMRLAPRVSGKMTALAVGLPFVITAVLFPALLDIPRWAEMEVVLASWWFIFSCVLAVLLYRGYRLRDDFLFVAPWKRSFRGKTGDDSSSCGSLSGCDGCGSAPDAEGIVFLIALVVAALVLFGAAWLVAEIAMPVVLFLGYATITRALTQVAHDTHACEGALAKSIGWGALWGAIYTTPLAVFVYVVFRFIA